MTSGVCNHPGSDTLDRFIWVLSFLAHNDFVVVPVDQLQYDDGVVVDRHTWGKVGPVAVHRVCTAGMIVRTRPCGVPRPAAQQGAASLLHQDDLAIL